MPMRVFINALCDQDYSEVENFDNIQMEFAESVGGESLKRIITEKGEIECKKARYLCALSLIELLNIRYSEKNFEDLKELNYHALIPAPALDNYVKYITQIDGWVKRDEMDFRKLSDENKAKEQEEKKKQAFTYTRDYFASMYVAFMETIKVTLTDETTVRMYCQCAKRYQQYCEFMDKQRKAA